MREFFSENEKLSMTRLMCFICVVAAILLAFFKSGSLELVITFLSFGLGAKTIQKFKE